MGDARLRKPPIEIAERMYGGRVAESFQPPFGSREERMAYNEAWCRGINERKAEWMKGGDAVAGFRCECWLPM
jgi:hypothetical protein